MTDPEGDDAPLVERLCQGEAAAAHALYQRHGAALLRFGVAMSGSRQTAEDVVHDTFLEFLYSPQRFDPVRGTLVSYLYGIARHQISRLRRQAMAVEEMDEVMEDDTVFQIDRTQRIDHVRRAVLALPLAQREVIALCDLEELPYAMVASILDCPIGTVRSRLHRARALLAPYLASIRDAETRDQRAPTGDLDRSSAPAVDTDLAVPFTYRETPT